MDTRVTEPPPLDGKAPTVRIPTRHSKPDEHRPPNARGAPPPALRAKNRSTESVRIVLLPVFPRQLSFQERAIQQPALPLHAGLPELIGGISSESPWPARRRPGVPALRQGAKQRLHDRKVIAWL